MNKFKLAIATCVVAGASLVPAQSAMANATPGAHVQTSKKDPCFFTDAEWRQWKTEKNGSPGWNDSLAHVQGISGGCLGFWSGGDQLTGWNGHTCTWRVWAQDDGQQVWIAFCDWYPNSPRFRAHEVAGIVSADGSRWVQQLNE